MPKKKTGQRKKAEKQKARQKEIAANKYTRPLADLACNSVMECDKCERKCTKCDMMVPKAHLKTHECELDQN